MLFLLAGAGLLIGFLLLGSLSTREPEAVPPSTSTTSTSTTQPIEPPLDLENFSVSQISRGEPFVWEQTLGEVNAYPMALLEHDGWIYLFAGSALPWFERDEGGLRGWRTVDGASWESLGQVITEPHIITQLTSTDQGLVAVGWNETNRGLEVLRSGDGISWTLEELPVDDLDPFTYIYPTAVGSSDTLLVVAGHAQVDIIGTLQERISSGHDFDPGRYGWNVEEVGDGLQLSFYGPLGFPLGVITAEELELSQEETEALVAAYRGASWASIAWTKSGDGGWVQSETLDAFSVESLNVMPDDSVVAFGYGSTSASTRKTHNGVDWESTGSGGPYRVHHWNERLIGTADSGRPSMLVSEEDGSWSDIGPGQLFPYELGWSIEGFGAGPGGIAAIIRGWDQAAAFEQPEPLEPVTITSNGATLALNFERGSYTLNTTDGAAYSWSMNGSTAPEGVVPDLDSDTISFHDPETGDFLASFAIDEIFEAENEYWSGYSGGDSPSPLTAFAFTQDGADWSIQDAGEAWGDIWISHLEVTESQVVAAGVVDALYIGPTDHPSFEVWTAAIP